jgi:hypothetical protein
MDWSTITTVIASLGGVEFVKWLANRKTYARKELVHVKAEEQNLYSRQIEWYEKRLGERDLKVDALYKELRESQARELELIEKCNKLELEKTLLVIQKCEERGCGKRKPPSDY